MKQCNVSFHTRRSAVPVHGYPEVHQPGSWPGRLCLHLTYSGEARLGLGVEEEEEGVEVGEVREGGGGLGVEVMALKRRRPILHSWLSSHPEHVFLLPTRL